MNKLVLGTAQFGLDYGINNKTGKIPRPEAREILKTAIESGIDTFDTAFVYGESEQILGDFMSSCVNKINIISKLPECKYSEVGDIVSHSLDRLRMQEIYGFLVHSFKNYKSEPKIWDELIGLRAKGKINKIGFSLYYPYELEYILKLNISPDFIQVPFSVFDQRFSPYFPALKKKGIGVYARSVFLQGLAFKKPEELGGYFKAVKEKIEQLNFLSKESEIPVFALCLSFALGNNDIDKIVFGVDSLRQLKETTHAPDYILKFNSHILYQLRNLKTDEEKIILPFNWGLPKEVIV